MVPVSVRINMALLLPSSDVYNVLTLDTVASPTLTPTVNTNAFTLWLTNIKQLIWHNKSTEVTAEKKPPADLVKSTEVNPWRKGRTQRIVRIDLPISGLQGECITPLVNKLYVHCASSLSNSSIRQLICYPMAGTMFASVSVHQPSTSIPTANTKLPIMKSCRVLFHNTAATP